ncbi:MAG: hypothetical protein HDR43_02370 [Mycoplasma sp.]|nr:hypothetical protein [Mycoplasma sp.]
MSKIETKNLAIFNYFKFSNDSSDLELDNKKINFIYANNGSGKSTLAKYLNLTCKENFYLIDINRNIYIQDSNKMIISKNISEINSLKNKVEEIYNTFSQEVKNIINSYNLSTRDSMWKNLMKPYYNSFKKFNDLVLITDKSKNDIKNLQLTYDQIINLNLELNNFDIDITESSDFKFDKELLINEGFENILVLKGNIENKLKNFEIEVKKEVIKEFEKTNIDIYVLEEIYSLINNIDKMEKCYICNNNIQDFNSIKLSMERRINELRNKFSNLIDLNDDLDRWDSIFNTTLVKEYKNKKSNEINFIINQSYENLSNYLLNYVFDLKKMINEEKKVELINNLKSHIAKIEELEKDRKLKSINIEDFNVFKSIISNLLGEGRIKFNFNSNNFIEINLENQDNLPFSSGEIKIISFIFSMMYFISSFEDYTKRFVIIDDIDESFDNLNIINFVHIMKTFFYDYKIRFLVLTHNNQLIKQIYDSGIKDVNIFLIYRLVTFERNLIKLNNKNIDEEISYLGFKTGIKLLKDKISKDLSRFNENQFTLIFIYTQWILRIINLITNTNNENKNYSPILILKYENLFGNKDKEGENIFNKAKDEFKKFYNLDDENFLNNISYDSFIKSIEKFKDLLPKLKIEFDDIPNIMITNITNIVKFVILREMIKSYLMKLSANFTEEINNESIRLILNNLHSKGIISLENKKKLNYLWNFLSTYCHVEITPSLLLNGIELNDFIVHKVINDAFELIGDR